MYHHEATDVVNGTKSKLDVCSFQCLQYFSADGSKVSIRPSVVQNLKSRIYSSSGGIKMDKLCVPIMMGNAAAWKCKMKRLKV